MHIVYLLHLSRIFQFFRDCINICIFNNKYLLVMNEGLTVEGHSSRTQAPRTNKHVTKAHSTSPAIGSIETTYASESTRLTNESRHFSPFFPEISWINRVIYPSRRPSGSRTVASLLKHVETDLSPLRYIPSRSGWTL